MSVSLPASRSSTTSDDPQPGALAVIIADSHIILKITARHYLRSGARITVRKTQAPSLHFPKTSLLHRSAHSAQVGCRAYHKHTIQSMEGTNSRGRNSYHRVSAQYWTLTCWSLCAGQQAVVLHLSQLSSTFTRMKYSWYRGGDSMQVLLLI